MMRQCAKTLASVKRMICGSSCPVFATNSKYLKDIPKRRNRMGLNWEDVQDICGRCEGKILQVVTIVLDTVANENATISIAAIFCSVKI